MTLLSRFIANALLPLLFFYTGYLLLYRAGNNIIPELPLKLFVISIALLLASLPPITFSFLIRSQLKKGFALLKNGNIVTLSEITLDMVITNRIKAWKLYQQHLDTEVCLQGENELIYVELGLDFQLPPNDRGKQFVRHYNNNIAIFEAWVQRAIYLASLQDKELVQLIPKEVLLNEEDERVLRSKFLSALEAQPLESIRLPLDTNSLTVNRKVRKRAKANSHRPISHHDLEHPSTEALKLDPQLLHELGLKDSS